jgi:hypothetical protein
MMLGMGRHTCRLPEKSGSKTEGGKGGILAENGLFL